MGFLAKVAKGGTLLTCSYLLRLDVYECTNRKKKKQKCNVTFCQDNLMATCIQAM